MQKLPNEQQQKEIIREIEKAEQKSRAEIIILEAYKEGSISVGKVRELLGFKTRLEVDTFLKEKGIDLTYSAEDLESDRQTHHSLS